MQISFAKTPSRLASRLMASAAVSEYYEDRVLDAKEADLAEADYEYDDFDPYYDPSDYEFEPYDDEPYYYDDPYEAYHMEDCYCPTYYAEPLAAPLVKEGPDPDAGKSLGDILFECLSRH